MMQKHSNKVFVFPDTFFESSDLQKVLELVASFCHSDCGKKNILNLQPYTDPEFINWLHAPVGEAIQMLQSGIQLPVIEFNDNRNELQNIRVEGFVIDPENLHILNQVLHLTRMLRQFFVDHPSATHLNEILQSSQFHFHIFERVQKIIDEHGSIRDNASDELFHLRKEYARNAKEIEKRLYEILKTLKLSGIAAEETNLTIRNGRSVIPVPANMKYKVKGIIHDESATGQTVYIEPIEIVEIGNKLRENLLAQQREIRKILADISKVLRIYLDDILQYYEILGYVDANFAKARFALQYQAILPKITNKPVIEWKNAKHLLLQIHLEKQGKKIIPLNISLNNDNRLLVLSGANAGGKSVVLKTVALLQAMIQCGLPVPLDEHSTTGVFTSILMDIGDGQSIEANLSTYSSHLELMKVFLAKAQKGCLYLIDEIGSGTDPILGGALAQAILLQFHRQGAIGIVTTHLDMLKKMADETPGATNGAMVFDQEKLQPSYILRTGLPGYSFTFEIAARTGIPKHIIEKAKAFAGNERLTFEQKISDVEKKTQQLLESLEKQKIAEDFLEELIAKYKALIDKAEKQQAEIIQATRAEAQELISKANKTIENTIRAIRESSAEKTVTAESRKETKQILESLRQFTPSKQLENNLKQKAQQIQSTENAAFSKQKFQVGMHIKHTINGMEGTIIEIFPDGKIKVAFQSVAMTLEPDQVIPASSVKPKTQSVKLKSDVYSKINTFKRTLDIRGVKAEEVMYILEKYIDDALLIGVYDFSILHGKGYGVLRSVVRQLLAKHPNVDSFEGEHVERGGDGVTIVKLKK